MPARIEDAPQIFQEMLTEEEQMIYLKLSPTLMEEFKGIFDIFDMENNGTIQNDEITKVLNGLGENPTKEQVDELIVQIDYDQNGKVDFEEFTLLMVKIKTNSDRNPEPLVNVFKRFDVDGDGQITWQDVLSIFTEIGHDIDEAEAREMVHFFDKDEDNSINFLEFVQLMMFDTTDEAVKE